MRTLALTLLLVTSFFASAMPQITYGSFYDGGGVEAGINDAKQIDTGGTGNARETILNILFAIISFMGIIAVIVIVIAGIILIVGGSDEQQRQKAWKMVLYAIIGLIIILLAGVLVRTTVHIFD